MNRPDPIRLLLNRRNLIANIATLVSSSALAQAALALAALLIARRFGPEVFGYYTSVLLIAAFTAIVFNLGLDIWLLREGGCAPGFIGQAGASVLAVKAALGLFWLAGFVAVAASMRSHRYPFNLAFWGALTVLLGALLTSALTVFRAVLRNRISALLESGSSLLWLLAVALLVSYTQHPIQHYLLVRAVILAAVLAAAIHWAHAMLKLQPNRRAIRRLLAQCPSYAASEFLSALFLRCDVLIIALLLDRHAVGLYAPAAGVVNSLFLAPGAVYTVLVPTISHLFVTHRRQGWLTSLRSIAMLAAIGGLLASVIFLGAPYFVCILGSAYAATSPILKILSLVLLLHSINIGLAGILVAANRQSSRSLMQAAATGANILLNLLVAPQRGIQGVAVVYVATEVILLVGYSWLAYDYFRRTRWSE